MFHDKQRLIKKIYDGVRGVAYKTAFSKEQAKDFLQEGLIAALEAIDRYPDHPESELILLIARSAYNRIVSVRGKDINHSRRHVHTDGTFEPPSPPSDDYDERQFVAVLNSRLSSLGRKVLREKLRPGNAVVDIMRSEIHAKMAAREAGKLVMNVHAEKITDTHIAKALGVSKATVSREIKRIREAAADLMRE